MITTDESPRPFWQALLLVLAPVAMVALIEQVGATYREHMKPKPPDETPPTKGP